MSSNNWFNLHDAGFIRQQVGRDPVELVREVIQNPFDAEGVSHVCASITWDDTLRAVRVEVEDDGAGFDTLEEAFTVFLSGKFDDPTKRGRKGRGLKEAIAVCHSAVVEALGQSALFTTDRRTRSRKVSKNKRTYGTRVEMLVKRWFKRDISPILKHLATFEPPAGVTFEVNGEVVGHHEQVEKVAARLQTLIVEDEEDRYETRNTEVVLLRPRRGERPHVYEMGIPVCEIDMPWHVDVQQRMPIPDHRTTVKPSWLRKLKTQVLDAMAASMTKHELDDGWVHGVLERASTQTQAAYVDKVYGDKVAVRTPGDQAANSVAEEQLGLTVINSSHLPKGVRAAFLENRPSTREALRNVVLEDRKRNSDDEFDGSEPTLRSPPVPTAAEAAVLRVAKWLAEAVTGRAVDTRLKWSVSSLGNSALAAWFPGDQAILFSRAALGARFFADPLSPKVLRLIIHEVAHIVDDEHGHGAGFTDAVEEVAGKVARLMLDCGEELRSVAAGGEA